MNEMTDHTRVPGVSELQRAHQWLRKKLDDKEIAMAVAERRARKVLADCQKARAEIAADRRALAIVDELAAIPPILSSPFTKSDLYRILGDPREMINCHEPSVA